VFCLTTTLTNNLLHTVLGKKFIKGSEFENVGGHVFSENLWEVGGWKQGDGSIFKISLKICFVDTCVLSQT